MSKHRLKLLIWAGLVALLPVLLFAGLRLAGYVISTANEGANPETALNIVPNVPPDLDASVTWLQDAADTGRRMEPQTRTLVESAYLRAWLQWNLSYAKGEPFGLETYFTGPALAEVTKSVERSAGDGLRVEQADTTHVLQLHLYSADGSIVSFTDTRAVVGQVIHDSTGAPAYVGETWATYDVVMLLQDGNWAVRHWLRTGDITPAINARAQDPSIATSDGVQLLVDGAPYPVAGINYYPSATPWDRFWSTYDGETIDADFAVIRGLGLNTIRIFIPFHQFGGAQPHEEYLLKLDDLLDRASAHELKVIVTLFDFRVDYRLLSWPETDRHLEALIPRYREHSAILAWDLKNEPDRDYGAGVANVQAWLRHVARLVRFHDPNHLMTIGWSTPNAAQALTDVVDLISFHYYALASDLPGAFASIRAVAPDRPIMLGEFGLPTWNSFFFPHGHTEREQASYYADVLTAMRATDGAGYLAWTLYDFPEVPPSVAGRFPWQVGPQGHLGVIRADGTAKPAAALLAPGAVLDGVPREYALARFFKPFWLLMLTTFACGVAIMALVGRWVWRKRRRRTV